MKKFNSVIEKYTAQGVRIDNIEYAIDSAKGGSKRQHTLENLTADYRGMELSAANRMLEDIYKVNGGEFKKENRNGYLYGIFLLMIGLGCSYYIYSVFHDGGVLVRPVIMFLAAIAGTLGGIILILASVFGKYRDNMEPFTE